MARCMQYTGRENSIHHVEFECDCAAAITGGLVWRQLSYGSGGCLDGEWIKTIFDERCGNFSGSRAGGKGLFRLSGREANNFG